MLTLTPKKSRDKLHVRTGTVEIVLYAHPEVNARPFSAPKSRKGVICYDGVLVYPPPPLNTHTPPVRIIATQTMVCAVLK